MMLLTKMANAMLWRGEEPPERGGASGEGRSLWRGEGRGGASGEGAEEPQEREGRSLGRGEGRSLGRGEEYWTGSGRQLVLDFQFYYHVVGRRDSNHSLLKRHVFVCCALNVIFHPLCGLTFSMNTIDDIQDQLKSISRWCSGEGRGLWRGEESPERGGASGEGRSLWRGEGRGGEGRGGASGGEEPSERGNLLRGEEPPETGGASGDGRSLWRGEGPLEKGGAFREGRSRRLCRDHRAPGQPADGIFLMPGLFCEI